MFETIKKDLMNAMKEQDKFKLSVLRMLKSALQSEEINKKDKLTDTEILNVIKKQVKIRTASLEEYTSYNRIDLAQELEKEINILKEYLPQELNDDELNRIIEQQFEELKPTNIKDMGKLIKAISNIVGTRADMSVVSKIVKDKLNNI